MYKNIVIYTFVVVPIAAAFCLYRSSVGFVWDDSFHLTANKYDVPNPNILGQNGSPGRILKDSFAEVSLSGYRPLSTFINKMGVFLFCNSNTSPYPWFFLVGLVLGLTFLSMYLISRRYLKTKPGAVLAVLLFAFSMPVITASWVVFAGIQSIVPLLVCSGLLLYWKIFESKKYHLFYFIVLCLLLFTGPWFREFIGFLPLLLIFLEIRRVRRPTILMVVLSIFFLHSLFPTFLPKIIFFENLPLKSIFSLGSLGDQVGSISASGATFFVKRLLSSVRWQVPFHFITLLPPVILGIILLDYVLFSFMAICKIAAPKAPTADHRISRKESTLVIISFLLLLCLMFLTKDQNNKTLLCLTVCLILFLQGLRIDPFLSLWFLLFFMPFLWVFTEQVHLAYALLPAAIIVAKVTENIGIRLNKSYRGAAVLRYLFLFLIFFELADQSLNLYGSYKVVNGISRGIHSVSASIKQHLPKNSIVVTNAMHLDDTRLYNDNWVRIFYTVQAGITRREDGNTIDPAVLEKLLQDNFNKRDVYFISVDFDYTPDKVNYHSHKYLRNRSVPVVDMGIINITQVRYPYLDPLKAYIPRPFISFPGPPPDLENDFYRGPAQNKMPFLRKVYCEYHLYKVVGTQVTMQEKTRLN